jgi:hypothetical protein
MVQLYLCDLTPTVSRVSHLLQPQFLGRRPRCVCAALLELRLLRRGVDIRSRRDRTACLRLGRLVGARHCFWRLVQGHRFALAVRGRRLRTAWRLLTCRDDWRRWLQAWRLSFCRILRSMRWRRSNRYRLQAASGRGRGAVKGKATMSADRAGAWGALQGVKVNTLDKLTTWPAEGTVLNGTGRAATRSSFTGETECSYTAWCHARIMQALGSHSRGTTASVKTVDHHDIQVGREPVGASADQVQGIQERSGSQACERIGVWQRHGCGGRRTCCEVKRTRASGDTSTCTCVVVSWP